MLKKFKKLFYSSVIILTVFFLINGASFAAGCEGDPEACLKGAQTSQVMKILTLGVNFLAAAAMLIAVIMIIVAGIEYATSSGDANKVADAKKKITNVLISLVALFLLFSLMQWLIPGNWWEVTTGGSTTTPTVPSDTPRPLK